MAGARLRDPGLQIACSIKLRESEAKLGTGVGSTAERYACMAGPPSRNWILNMATRHMHCRAVPASQIEAAREVGVGLTRACMAAPVYMDTVVPDAGLVPVGEVRQPPGMQSWGGQLVHA